MTPSERFARERHLVELLMKRIGFPVTEYSDPNAESGEELGVDVAVISPTGRMGIQVTELDSGTLPGLSRSEEKKIASQAACPSSGVYGAWAQNDPKKLLLAIDRAIARKSRVTPSARFDELWLLISCGIPELGSVVSSLAMTPWVSAADLDGLTLESLAKSRYRRVFLHSVIGIECALYEWHNGSY
jgi:hypothetical protein